MSYGTIVSGFVNGSVGWSLTTCSGWVFFEAVEASYPVASGDCTSPLNFTSGTNVSFTVSGLSDGTAKAVNVVAR
jgi:hypothetical protein